MEVRMIERIRLCGKRGTRYPRADRHLSQAIRRLSRLHVRSTEQPVNL
jgi:hypothetical protein